jgi:hypothetical protein
MATSCECQFRVCLCNFDAGTCLPLESSDISREWNAPFDTVNDKEVCHSQIHEVLGTSVIAFVIFLTLSHSFVVLLS